MFTLELPSLIAAATALLDQPNLTAEDIVKKSMKIAGDICVYTNHNLVVEKIDAIGAAGTPAGSGAIGSSS